MKILAETHAHTCVSDHAYSTAAEMINQARAIGLELLSITNHGPELADPAHLWHFGNLCAIPRNIDGFYVLRGAEANLTGAEGELDIPDWILKKLDIVIASVHRGMVSEEGGIAAHTNAYLNVMRNPHVDVLGHCGYKFFEFDMEAVLEEAKKNDKIIEINAHTFAVRQDSIPNCYKIAELCKKIGVKVAASTDAHSIYELGNVKASLKVFSDVGMPEELIINTSAEKLLSHLCNRKGLDRQKFECTECV